jgi:hypothetical protein
LCIYFYQPSDLIKSFFFLVLLVRRVASSLDEREQYTFFNTRRALASSEGYAGVMSAAQLIDTLPHTLMDGIGG